MAKVVVGVDGSANARVALDWAAKEAALRQQQLQIVMAWHEPYVGGAFSVPVVIDPVEMETSFRTLLNDVVADARAAHPGLDIDGSLVHDSPASALLGAADDDDLLVVGGRGHGGFLGLLMGSVSSQVVGHATCPVVVVPHPDDG